MVKFLAEMCEPMLMLFDVPAVPGVARLGIIDTGGYRACFLDLNVTAIDETNGAIASLLEGTLVDDIDVDAAKGLVISVDADPRIAVSMTLDASEPGVWADYTFPLTRRVRKSRPLEPPRKC